MGGWNLNVRDTDGHAIIIEGKTKEITKPIKIDDHVWIGADVTILKGTHIKTDSVVASNSIVAGLSVTNPGCLIAGCPAKVKKQSISWEK